MFELEWWCYVVSAALGAVTLVIGRREELSPVALTAWLVAVVITWVAVIPFGFVVAMGNRRRVRVTS